MQATFTPTPKTPRSDYYARLAFKACRRLEKAIKAAEELREQEGETAADVFEDCGRTFTILATIQH